MHWPLNTKKIPVQSALKVYQEMNLTDRLSLKNECRYCTYERNHVTEVTCAYRNVMYNALDSTSALLIVLPTNRRERMKAVYFVGCTL